MEERVRPKIKRILKDHNMKIDWDCLCDDKILKIINAEINLAKKELLEEIERLEDNAYYEVINDKP